MNASYCLFSYSFDLRKGSTLTSLGKFLGFSWEVIWFPGEGHWISQGK